MRKKDLLTLFFVPVFCLVFAQAAKGQGRADTTIIVTDTTNIEALFKKARELSYDNKYSQARRICQKILEKKPNYYEVRTFLGRTYAWEKQYDNARTELSRVLIERENDYEALNALFDVEFWTESYSLAGDYLKIALGFYPTSEELLIKKAKLQIKLEEKGEAALTLRRILDLNPGQKEAIRLMNTLEGRKLSNNFQTGFLVDLFDSKNPQHLYSVEVGHNFNFGSLTFRNNYADRFNKKGLQFELESYAHFTSKNYVNLLVGYSDKKILASKNQTSGIFPDYKFTGEIYQKLPKGFEVSFGIRYQKFSKSSTFYSASLSNYYKDYWFSIRTFITPKTDSIVRDARLDKTSVTVIGNIRVYFGDSDNYLGFKAGSGRSPDETETLDVATFYQTFQGGVELQKRAFGRWLMKCDVSYGKETPVRARNIQRISTTITLKTVF
jgi:YaiO family outer membrane protein